MAEPGKEHKPIDETITQVGTTAGDMLDKERRGAADALRDTSADLSQKASDLASEAKEETARKVEGAAHGLGDGLKLFADALAAAGDRLGEGGQQTGSRLVSEAAAGVQSLSDSLSTKSLGDMVEELRALGRRNKGGLFAGSVLAGLALGRLWQSAGAPGTAEADAANTIGTGQDAAERVPVEGAAP